MLNLNSMFGNFESIIRNKSVIKTVVVNKKLHSIDEPAVVFKNGDWVWYKRGLVHREGGPAVKLGNNYYWAAFGVAHRDDGPAFSRSTAKNINSFRWYSHGDLHRIDGPAEILGTCDGKQICTWYRRGVIHRWHGPACYTLEPGQTETVYGAWLLHDKYHRDDGPAIIHKNGMIEYYHKGQRHNKLGPAVVYPDSTCEWYWKGEKVDPVYHNFLCFSNSKKKAVDIADSIS